jgi:hypothetical protein
MDETASGDISPVFANSSVKAGVEAPPETLYHQGSHALTSD